MRLRRRRTITTLTLPACTLAILTAACLADTPVSGISTPGETTALQAQYPATTSCGKALEFSGLHWRVSDASEASGLDVPPGFTWDCANAQIDPLTQDLVLTLRWDGVRWTGAQLKTVVVDAQMNPVRDSTFGYGKYMVDLPPPARHANPSPVFGFFFYANPHRVGNTDEIDVEVTRWSETLPSASDVTYSAYPPNGFPIGCASPPCPWQRSEVAGAITSGLRRYLIDWGAGQVVFERMQGTPLRSAYAVGVPAQPDPLQVPARPMPLVLNFWVESRVKLPNPGRWTFRVRKVVARPDRRRTGVLDLTLRGLPPCGNGLQAAFINVQHSNGTVADSIFSDTTIHSLPPGKLTVRPRTVTCGVSTYRPTSPTTEVLLAAGGRVSATVTFVQNPPTPNGWTRLSDMPLARHSIHALVARDGRIYLIGGVPDPSRIDIYDPSADSWSTSSMSLSVSTTSGGGAGILNDKIYFPFVPTGGGFNSSTYELDPSTSAVRVVHSTPGWSFACGRTVAVGSELLVQGNLSSSYFFVRYSSLASTPTFAGLHPPSGHSCAPVYGVEDGRLWVGGGYSDQGSLGHLPLKQVVSFDLADLLGGTLSWRVEPNLATAHLDGAAVLYNKRITVVGGDCDTSACVNADAAVLDIQALHLGWAPFPNPAVRRRSHAAVVSGGVLYIFGGDEFEPSTGGYRGATRAVERITLP